MACKPLDPRRKRAKSVRPPENDARGIIAPLDDDLGDLKVEDQVSDGGVVETNDKWEELANKYETLEKQVHDYLQEEAKTEGWNPPIVKFPPKMTREEWDKHQVTHTPYAPGCKHCVAARAIRRRHPRKRQHSIKVKDVDGSDEGPTKVSMDYMYLSERSQGDQESANNLPHLVVLDHRHGRLWAHRVPQKGVLGKAEWVPRRVTQDLHNNGMNNVTIHVKTDQEPAIVSLQTAMQDLIPDHIIPISSPVRESECNGRIENGIRRAQEKIRTLRHQLENNIKQRVPYDAPVMAWLVRWVAELLSKYAVGDDGKTPYERIHREDCVIPLVPFGETVMYVPLKTVHRNKGIPAKKAGVWLGVNERTEEMLIGTEFGVIKCRTVDRFNEKDRWHKHNVLGMIGTPWEPVPGRNGQHIPVDVADDGQHMGPDNENEEQKDKTINDEDDEQDFKESIDTFHVSRKAVREFGETVGCPVCDIIKVRGDRPGRIGRHHPEECRKRILAMMMHDPAYRHVVKRYKSRVNGDGDNIEGDIDNILRDTQQHNTQKDHMLTKCPTAIAGTQHTTTTRPTRDNDEQEEIATMRDTVKKPLRKSREISRFKRGSLQANKAAIWDP